MKTRSGIGSLILVATMIVVLLLGCSTSTQSPPASSGTAADAKPYGSAIVAWAQTFTTLDGPVQPSASVYPGLGVLVFDSLTTLDAGGNVGPGLAERWEISDDGLTHTFYIRKGVKWHDGTDLTGADVKFTMDRMNSTAIASAITSMTFWRTLGPEVTLKDDYTVVVRVKTPSFDVLKPIMDYQGALAVVPKKYIEEKGVDYFRKNPMGSGPFKIVSFIPGQRIELEANENYWDTTMIPKFKNLTVLTVPEELARVAMLKTGEADIADVSPEQAVALKAAGLRIKAWDGGQQSSYALLYDLKNPTQYAFSDLRVRKATSLALNRQELADKLYRGYAEPGILNLVQRTFDFFDATQLKPDPYDPDGAKKLLAEAGYPNGFDTKIWDTGQGGVLSTYIQAMEGYWRKVGISGTLVPYESGPLAAIIRTYSDPRIWNSIWSTGLGVSLSTGRVGFDIASSFSNRSGFYKNHTNTKLDDLIDQYPKTKDPAQKKQIAREALILAKNEYSVISGVIVQATYALGPKIGDITPIQGWAVLGRPYLTMTHPK